MRIYLIGFMGAGKTEVGRNLATRLGLPFLDLDEAIERQSGKPIPSIFLEEGEAGFRRREAEALAGLSGHGVVATGGGTPVDPENRARMRRTGRVVWLNVSFEQILDRLPPSSREGRPLFADVEAAARLFAERQGAYRDHDLEIVVGPGEAVEQTAERIAHALQEARCAT